MIARGVFLQESEQSPDKKISPEQADAFAAELAPGWAAEDPLEAESKGEAEAAPPVAGGSNDAQTVKNASPPKGVAPEPAANNDATEISIQQPETAPTQPSLVTPEQTAPAARDVEVREMRRAAAAPATVQVRAPDYHDDLEPKHGQGRALVNLALILLGIGVGIGSVMIYLEVRESNRPANANEGFETAEAPSTATPSAPVAARADKPTPPQAQPSAAKAAQEMFEQAEREVTDQAVPKEPKIILRLKTTPPEATVTVDGVPFENPFEGEVDQGGEHLFVARADGYQTERLRVRFDSDRRVQMDLSPVQKKTAKARRRTRPTAHSAPPRRAPKPAAQSTSSARKPATFVTDNPY